MNSSDNGFKEKDIAFYSAALSAWYTTKFERDKHLLSLSTAGVGLLVTLLTAVGVRSIYTIIVYVLALVPYIICIISVLAIFQRNADYLQRVVQGNDESDIILSLLDKLASSSFVVGVFFTILVGLFSVVDNNHSGSSDMTENSNKMINTSNDTEKRSVNGATAMKPQSSAPSGQSTNSNNEKKN